MGMRLVLATLFLLSVQTVGCSSTPPAGPPYPSAVIADADTGVFEIESDPQLPVLPATVPVRTRWNNQVVDGFFLPPGSAGARMWIVEQPSKERGVGTLLIPMSVEWRGGQWTVHSRQFDFLANIIVRAGQEPLPAAISSASPGGPPAGPPDFPGIFLSM
ncbi:MAG: hypothetical protein U0570_02425 [Phycisphaerales bacterium]